MASLLDLYRSVFGGEADQGAPMAVQNRQGGFDPYTPAPVPDALDLLYELSGGKDLSQAYGAAQRGDYLPALGQGAWGAAQAATMAYPALKAGGAALRAGAPLAREAAAAMPGLLADETGAIRAFHASPFDFNKFDLSKVGSGQGAQSYGHGIYAAESPAVSGRGGQYDLEFTAKNLGKYDLNPGELQIHRMLRADRSDMGILGELARGGGYTFDEALAALERVKGAKAKIYEVDIHADPKAFLDWDRALIDQPQGVQDLAAQLKSPVISTDIRRGTLPGGGTYQALMEQLAGIPADAPGSAVAFRQAAPAASQALKDAGIPGIRYLDQGSRFNPSVLPDNPIANEAREFLKASNGDAAAALQAFRASNPIERWGSSERDEIRKVIEAAARQPTSNYAIFDPSIIEIRRKYGILPPAIATGGLLATQGEPPT